MAFRFLHLADLHLETRFGGRETTRERLRTATREAFEAAVRLALEERLHALLLAGDVFDDPLLSRRTELWLVGQLRRLAQGGVHVLYAAGNHDPGGAGKRLAGLGLEDAPWAERVHLFRTTRVETVQVTDGAGDAVGVVCGCGHPTDAEQRNLAAGFRKYKTDLPLVGLLHTQVESAQRADEHARYAPSTRADLAAVDYDYWALGHVHLRQRPFDDLPAWYPGNLVGRNPKETGPKGGLCLELEAGEPAEPTFVPLAPVRWERLAVAADGAASLAALVDRLAMHVEEARSAGDQELCCVLELEGRTPFAASLRDGDQRAEIEEELLDRTQAVEIQLRTARLRRPRELADLRRTPSVVQRALELVESAAGDPQLLARLAPEVLAGLEQGADREAYLTQLLQDLDEELLERALEEPEEEPLAGSPKEIGDGPPGVRA